MSINREEWKKYAKCFNGILPRSVTAILLGFPDSVTQSDLDHIHSLIKGVGDGVDVEWSEDSHWGRYHVSGIKPCAWLYLRVSSEDWFRFRLKPTPVKKRVPLTRDDLPNLFVVRFPSESNTRITTIQWSDHDGISYMGNFWKWDALLKRGFQWQRIGESQWNEFWKEVEG